MLSSSADEERLLTLKEVAARLSSSVRNVWRLIARGDLARPVRVVRSVRILASDFLAYLERLRRERDGGQDRNQGKDEK